MIVLLKLRSTGKILINLPKTYLKEITDIWSLIRGKDRGPKGIRGLIFLVAEIQFFWSVTKDKEGIQQKGVLKILGMKGGCSSVPTSLSGKSCKY